MPGHHRGKGKVITGHKNIYDENGSLVLIKNVRRKRTEDNEESLSEEEKKLSAALLAILLSIGKRHRQMFQALLKHINKVGEEKARFDKPKKLVKRLGLYQDEVDFDIPYKLIHAALVTYVLELNPDKVSIYAISMLTNGTREHWNDIYSVALVRCGDKNYPSENDVKAAKKEVLEPDTSPGADYQGDGYCIDDDTCPDYKYDDEDEEDSHAPTRGEFYALEDAIETVLHKYPNEIITIIDILSKSTRHLLFDIYRVMTEMEMQGQEAYVIKRFKAVQKQAKVDKGV